jgi:DNA adenine methylase
VPHLLKASPGNFGTYYEPFVGSAALFAAIKPRKSVLSDFNGALIDFYERLNTRPWLVYKKTKAIRVSKNQYYKIRAVDPNSLGKVDRAVRFFYLNRHCFNGVYRTNTKNQFNVPMGTKTGQFPSRENFAKFVDLLKTAELKTCDYSASIKEVKKNDFVYLDPPYFKTNDRHRGEYGVGGFSSDDIVTLTDCLKYIDAVGAKFILSYTNDERLRNTIQPDWRTKKINVRRSVAGFCAGRTAVVEVLITNY